MQHDVFKYDTVAAKHVLLGNLMIGSTRKLGYFKRGFSNIYTADAGSAVSLRTIGFI